MILTFQIGALDPAAGSAEGNSKGCGIPQVMRFTRGGWPQKNNNVDVEKYRKLTDSLSTLHGCLLYGTREVIPSKLRPQVLKLLHEGHFGMQQMKQLARTAGYWPSVDNDIVDLCRSCTS